MPRMHRGCTGAASGPGRADSVRTTGYPWVTNPRGQADADVPGTGTAGGQANAGPNETDSPPRTR
jgi:hypothetical protein